MPKFRIETDSMGKVSVPQHALYGAQTQRALDNFQFSTLILPAGFVRALAKIKVAAAQANNQLGLLDPVIADAIVLSGHEIINGQHLDQFPVDVFQTGSGTSTNMNANEVIATLASRALSQAVSPNDHVNMGQSSNDVIPTAIHLSAAQALHDELLPALGHLRQVINDKAAKVSRYVKTGRTHLMDAMPIRMDQELGAWQQQIAAGEARLKQVQPHLHQLAQGGTAVGTGINAHPDFALLFADRLSQLSGLSLAPSPDFFASLGTQDIAVELSGQLKTLAVSLMKIANDLRWMNAGPLAGLGEIELQPLQPGSSIMPGKVNPVIPEAVAMGCAQVIGNDTTITVAGQSGNFQLNVMLPVIAFNLLQSLELMSGSARMLADKAIRSFTVREDNLNQALALNPILVTALNPAIGYLKAADIAKKAYAAGRPIIDVAEEETDLSREQLLHLLDPAKLTRGGIPE